MKYLAYTAMFYTYLRQPDSYQNQIRLNQIFESMQEFKEFESLTWYHHACWQANRQETVTALASVEKALKLGFNQKFMLENDLDLHSIQSSKEFHALLIQYFGNTRKH
jgi:hypothetical protein